MQGEAHCFMSKKVAEKWFVGSYRHLQPFPKGNLYYAVRRFMGLSQVKVAALYGVSEQAWRYRERTKRLYHVAEVLALRDLCGMNDADFMRLLNDVA